MGFKYILQSPANLLFVVSLFYYKDLRPLPNIYLNCLFRLKKNTENY